MTATVAPPAKRHYLLCNERLLPRFGVDRLLLVLGRRLVREGHRVSFLCLRCDEQAVRSVSPRLHILEGVGQLSIDAAEHLAAELLSSRWDELFTDDSPDVLISGGWPFFGAARVCRRRGTRSVFIDAGAVPQDGMPASGLGAQRALRRIRAQQLPFFSAILPISEFIKESQTLPDRGSNVGVQTILLGADHLENPLFDAPDGSDVDRHALERLDRMLKSGQRPIMLLGRFEEQGYKNSPAALAVFERIQRELPAARLLILARDGEIQLPPHLAESIMLTGYVGDATLATLMQRCALGLSLSLWEGFNLPLAEMQWLGRPALAFSVGAHREVIVDPWMLCANPEEMAHKALQILNEGVPAHLETERGFDRFRSRFAWNDLLHQYVEALDRLVEEKDRPIHAGAASRRLVLIDCTNAAVDPANPGVIRVTRRLGRMLQDSAAFNLLFVRWDGRSDTYRLLTAAERETLASYEGPVAETFASLKGSLQTAITSLGGTERSILMLPEVPLDGAAQKRMVWARARGMTVAGVLYDIIPITHPLYCAREVVEKFPDYIETLASLDAIWPISEESLRQFKAYAQRSSLPIPMAEAVQLPGQFGGHARRQVPAEPAASDGTLRILCVCSIEPRKNHRTLVEAYRLLRTRRPDLPLQLVLVGHRFAEADDLALWLQSVIAEDPSIVWTGLLADESLAMQFDAAAFTVYPSVVEGFGLPIMESLWMGKPCLCHSDGVMAYLATNGGCMTVDMLDSPALSAAMEQLATQKDLLRRLTDEASRRGITDWQDYGTAIKDRILAL